MAKDDMEIIMYKILKYLYECMKHDVKPDLQKYGWHSDLMDIPQNYWGKIIKILADRKLIDGFSIVVTKDGIRIQTEPSIGITYEGREFLIDNNGMKKARECCGKAFDVLVSAAVGIIG